MPPTHSVVDEVVARHLARLHLGDATSVRPGLRPKVPKVKEEVIPERPGHRQISKNKKAESAQVQQNRQQFQQWLEALDEPLYPYEEDENKRVYSPDGPGAPRRVYLMKDGKHIGYWNGDTYITIGPLSAPPKTLNGAKKEFADYMQKVKLDLENIDEYDQTYLDSSANEEVDGKMENNLEGFVPPNDIYEILDEFDPKLDREAWDALVEQALDSYEPTQQDDVDLFASERFSVPG